MLETNDKTVAYYINSVPRRYVKSMKVSQVHNNRTVSVELHDITFTENPVDALAIEWEHRVVLMQADIPIGYMDGVQNGRRGGEQYGIH